MTGGMIYGADERCQRRAAAGVVSLWALLSLVFVLGLLPSTVSAQPRCVFLECGPGDAPNPNPAQAPKIEQATPSEAARSQHTQRPSSRGQVCYAAGGFDYCVSSVLKPQYGNTYGPANLVDEDLRTAWVEGVGGQGEGESITVDLGGPQQVSGIQLMNGYHKNARIFAVNSRVRSAIVRFSNGSWREVRLKDAPGVQELRFSLVEATWVQFEIRSVYPGSKYKDTAITEFRVLTGVQ